MECKFSDKSFGQSHFWIFDEFVEISIEACLCDDKAKWFGIVDVEYVDDMLRFDLLLASNLIFQQLHLIFVLESLQIDYFHTNHLISLFVLS